MIVARVRSTLRERGLVAKGAKVLLALSGGPDSAAMLSAMTALASELQLQLGSASVNHGLRPDAERDVEVARQQAEQCGVPFAALRIQLVGGADVQARARAARYSVLIEHAAALGAAHVAVGHTQNDQAETLLMRQLRGAGLRGLAGIDPARADGVIRPLIDCGREAVHAYARGVFGERIARDPSNEDLRFERVRIRHQLLPHLQAEDPRIVAHLADLADQARSTVAWLDDQAQALLVNMSPDEDSLPLAELRRTPQALLPALFRLWLLRTVGEEPSRAHVSQLTSCLSGRGEVWLPSGWLARVDDVQQLRLMRKPQ